jgi:purine-cytosine permease-like protein
MWVWISIAAGLVVALTIFGVACLRAWRQVKAVRASLTAVMAELQSYTDRMQVAAPGDRTNAV